MYRFLLGVLVLASIVLVGAGCGGGGGGGNSDGVVTILPVNISYVGPAAGSSNTSDAIEAAVEIWQQIFDQAGLILDVQYYSFDGPRDLPEPAVGDPLYTQISSATRSQALNIVIGADLDGPRGRQNEDFGQVGNIPGAVAAGPKSAAAFAITRVAGEDGRFNYDGPGATQLWEDEIEVAAEVLANLAGQYLGLEPVVTFQGEKVVATDDLSDTETCLTETACKNEESPRDNVMFPRVYKKPGEGDATYDRNKLSPQQIDILRAAQLVQR